MVHKFNLIGSFTGSVRGTWFSEDTEIQH